jgi:hypothetical protein
MNWITCQIYTTIHLSSRQGSSRLPSRRQAPGRRGHHFGAPTPTERSMRISRTTLFRICFTAQRVFFIAKPLRSYWFPSLASASFGRLLLRWSTILGYYPIDPGCFTENLWGFPRLAWLLHRRCHARCCLRPRGAGNHSSITRFPYRLRPLPQDQRFPKIPYSRG